MSTTEYTLFGGMHMKKTLFILSVLLLVFLVACQPAAEAPAAAEDEPAVSVESEADDMAEAEPAEEPAEEEIVIGFVGPLVGDTSAYGDSSRSGVELALDEIELQVKVIYENGGCNAKDATTAANKLIDVDGAKVILGTVCSSETLAIAPIAEQNGVVLLSAASSSPDITTAGDYVFRTWPSDKLQGPVMADHIIAEGHKTVAIIHTNSDYNLGLANAFTEAFEAAGGEILITEKYEQDARDFRTTLTKIKGKNPDAIYIVPYAEGGLLVKQAKDLGLEQPFFASETIGNQDFLDNAGDSAEGIIYATPSWDESASTTADFMQKHEAKFGEQSAWPVFSANSYDGMMLVAMAIEEHGYNADAVRDYLYAVADYDGAAGMLTIDENGDALKNFELMKIENGEFVKYE